MGRQSGRHELLARTVTGQSTVIAFDTAFLAVVSLFVVAVPALIAIKVGLTRRNRRSTARN